MTVDFGDILAGRGARPRQPQYQAVIEDFAGGIAQLAVAGPARSRQIARQLRKPCAGSRPADPNHPDGRRRQSVYAA